MKLKLIFFVCFIWHWSSAEETGAQEDGGQLIVMPDKASRHKCPHYHNMMCLLDISEKACLTGEGDPMRLMEWTAQESIWLCCCPLPYASCLIGEMNQHCLDAVDKHINVTGMDGPNLIYGLQKARGELLRANPEECAAMFPEEPLSPCGKDGDPVVTRAVHREDLFCEMMTWQFEELSDGNEAEFKLNHCPYDAEAKGLNGSSRKGGALETDWRWARTFPEQTQDHVSCRVCELALKEMEKHVKENKIKKKEDLEDAVDHMCEKRAPEGKWIHRFDIRQKSDGKKEALKDPQRSEVRGEITTKDPLIVVRRESLNECEDECKIVEKTCKTTLQGALTAQTNKRALVDGFIGKIDLKESKTRICAGVCKERPLTHLGSWFNEPLKPLTEEKWNANAAVFAKDRERKKRLKSRGQYF